MKISGIVDSETAAETLVTTLSRVRPDLPVNRSGLRADPSAPLPNPGDIRSLLSELALSAHEGHFELWPDRVVIGGLTDSLITQTALKIRAEPLLDGRTFINRICIVDSDDLPRIPTSLAGSGPDDAFPSAAPRPKAEESYLPPGFLLEKLLPMLAFVEQFPSLEKSPESGGPGAGFPRAMPIETTSTSAASDNTESDAPPLPGMVSTPIQEYEDLPSLLFSANSFFLQANQTERLDEIAGRLLSDERKGLPVLVEPAKPGGSPAAFSDYLSEKRAEEVLKLLSERGVDPGVFSVRAMPSSSTLEGSEVRLRIELPPPPSEPDPPVEGLPVSPPPPGEPEAKPEGGNG